MYPNVITSSATKKALHGLFYPRESVVNGEIRSCAKDDFFSIMWTRLNKVALRGWTPNHFVPLIKDEFMNPTTSTPYANAVKLGLDMSGKHENLTKMKAFQKSERQFKSPGVKVFRKEQKHLSNTSKSRQMKVDCTNTPAKKCKHKAVRVPMPSTESSFSELKDQTLPSNDNQFGNKKERINVKLQDRNVEQNSNPNPSSNQNKHDFLSSPVKICRKEQKRPSNTPKSFQVKVDCTNTPAKKCKHEAVRVPMPSTESSFSELKDQTLPNENNDNQFDNKKERINVKLQNRNVEQNYNPNPSSDQNKHDFLSSPVKVCIKEQKRPSNTSNSRQMKVDCTNTPAKKCKHEAVRVPMPSTESSFSELKDQTLPNNDNQFDNKKERINVKLQNRNFKQNSNSDSSPNQNKDDFLSSRVKVCRRKQKRPSNTTKSFQVKVDCTNTPAKKCKTLPNIEKKLDSKPVSKFSKDEYWKPSSSGNIGDFFDSSGTSTAEEKRLSDEEPASNIEIIDEQIPMPSTESSCSELKDQTLPNNDNQFDNKKQRINVKLQDRNVKQNSNPNASPNQSKDDFLSSRVKVCRKEQKRPSNPPAKKGKTDVVRVPIPSTESSCSELKDQALPNNDNRFDNKKENMDIKKELGNDTTKEKKKETESIPRPKTKDSFRSYFIPLKNSNNQNNVEVSEASPNVTNDDEEVLPLNGPNLRWYFEKGVNALANVARTEARMNNQVVFEDSKRKGLLRGGVTGNLSENIELLLEKLSAAG